VQVLRFLRVPPLSVDFEDSKRGKDWVVLKEVLHLRCMRKSFGNATATHFSLDIG